jgi:hypothetical protein
LSHGYPFDLAFGCDDAWRQAACILFSQFESGKEFNWNIWEFIDPS